MILISTVFIECWGAFVYNFFGDYNSYAVGNWSPVDYCSFTFSVDLNELWISCISSSINEQDVIIFAIFITGIIKILRMVVSFFNVFFKENSSLIRFLFLNAVYLWIEPGMPSAALSKPILIPFLVWACNIVGSLIDLHKISNKTSLIWSLSCAKNDLRSNSAKIFSKASWLELASFLNCWNIISWGYKLNIVRSVSIFSLKRQELIFEYHLESQCIMLSKLSLELFSMIGGNDKLVTYVDGNVQNVIDGFLSQYCIYYKYYWIALDVYANLHQLAQKRCHAFCNN